MFSQKLIPIFHILILSGILFFYLPGKTSACSDDKVPGISDTLFYFKGRVVDSLTREPVAFTHIINLGRGHATICDTLGYFFLRVRTMDTLKFSSIGYRPRSLVIEDSLGRLDNIPDIPLQSMRYAIEGVSINPLGSYLVFRSKVARLQLPESKYTIHDNVLNEIEEDLSIPDLQPNASITPITYLYNWLSKEGRAKRRYKALLEQEEFERQIAYKYSPLIVSGITGYSGFTLYRFMDFCSFTRKFLEDSDQYEIRDAVLAKQEIFEILEKSDPY
jgi:hypothetical protein